MNVLVADDDAVMLTLVQRLVTNWGYDCVSASDGNEAWERLQAPGAPGLAILDWKMPGISGLEIASKIRASGRPETYPYILMLTSKSPTDVFEALTSGADDYLTKPFDPQELRARLHVGARILNLQRELKAAYESAKHQASHDYLTGLLNRRLLVDLVRQELDRAERDGSPVIAIMCDIDDFKQVNDTRGHLAGDAVLVEVAHRIRLAARSYDHVGRYGGEEFLVIASNCDAAQGGQIAERIRSAVAMNPIGPGHLNWNVTVSVGVASRAPGMSVYELLAAADSAMYIAKRNGKNRCEIAAPVADASLGARNFNGEG